MIPETRTAKTRTGAKKDAVASVQRSTTAGTSAEGAAVVLDKQTVAGKQVRLATLSWCIGADDPWGQSVEHFLASVGGASQECGACDLLVAAGLTVADVPSAASILDKSGGCPVLFEARKNGIHSWFLAHRRKGNGCLTLVRQAQVVTSFNQYDCFPRLAGIVASGAGTIAFADTDLKFVLFICGENNVLDSTRRASVLKGVPGRDEDRERLAEVLSGPWVVLNPAHEPFYPQIRSTGFAKVGVVRSKNSSAGPTLRWLVEAKMAYRDGTESPVAAVHINNFSGDRPKTAGFAEVAFGDSADRVRRVQGPVVGSVDGTNAKWKSSVFEIQIGRIVS